MHYCELIENFLHKWPKTLCLSDANFHLQVAVFLISTPLLPQPYNKSHLSSCKHMNIAKFLANIYKVQGSQIYNNNFLEWLSQNSAFSLVATSKLGYLTHRCWKTYKKNNKKTKTWHSCQLQVHVSFLSLL